MQQFIILAYHRKKKPYQKILYWIDTTDEVTNKTAIDIIIPGLQNFRTFSLSTVVSSWKNFYHIYLFTFRTYINVWWRMIITSSSTGKKSIRSETHYCWWLQNNVKFFFLGEGKSFIRIITFVMFFFPVYSYVKAKYCAITKLIFFPAQKMEGSYAS